MNRFHKKFFSFIIAAAIVPMSFTFVYAQQAGSAKIEGSYQAVLKFPKASPTAILTFCPGSGDVPFTGNWTENDGEKYVNEMTKQKINGIELSFTIQAGPGIWEFVCTIDGKTIKGTVTGDGATSPFEGSRVTLKKDCCSK
ncbi:MAG: hypothetical protein JW944_01905 [Deltaproteobacteria bacterium]|nr:hypothetical protein [Deltaproteobacteria bacterium]